MKLTNFTGTLAIVDYKIVTKRPKKSNFALVELWLKLPAEKEFTFYDVSAGMSHDSYKDNFRRAVLLAEEKWGLDLLKIDINESAQL